jgi:deoxycytidylate deaminase
MNQSLVGKRVRMLNDFGSCHIKDKIGTCIYDNGYLLSVEFDDPIELGHNCNGRGKDGYCCYVYHNSVEAL